MKTCGEMYSRAESKGGETEPQSFREGFCVCARNVETRSRLLLYLISLP